MSKIVQEYNCGFISNDFESKSMINLLNNLDINQINNAKFSSNKAAKELCYEKESNFLINKILKKTF